MAIHFVQQWMNRPQSTWLRRAVFQIHLWAGICLGLYVTVVCVSGSALVFRNDLYDVLPPAGGPISPQVRLVFRALAWIGQLHGNLLLGPNGLTANAIGGGLVAVICLSGIIIWWPGISKWRRGLTIRFSAGWRRTIFDMHSAFGFWVFAILLMWGVTGLYFVFPQPFRATVNVFTPVDPPRIPQSAAFTSGPPPSAGQGVPFRRRRRRPLTKGEKVLRGFSTAHYGTFGGWPVKALWVFLGLIPAVLYGTALVMWWNRVLRPVVRRSLNSDSLSAEAMPPQLIDGP